MVNYVLKEYFVRYLRDVRQLKESSVKHYLDAIKYISKLLVSQGRINESLFEIHDVGELEIIKEYLKTDKEFIELDTRGHRMYSVGFNNYFRFASGEDFAKMNKSIEILDVKIQPDPIKTRLENYRNRSSIVKVQVIQYAKYQCEIDSNHKTFTTKSTNQQYMEGHHAIPMKMQDSFKDSNLDVYANVICLCPVCHRRIHYGIDSEKKVLLDKIYHDRSGRLANSGIVLSRDEFYSINM
ncbi:MAG: HNH endonuclease [Lachnospiraceae bacterium]|nr:HNH endonuclease [Lachnospiraceae bacterium]